MHRKDFTFCVYIYLYLRGCGYESKCYDIYRSDSVSSYGYAFITYINGCRYVFVVNYRLLYLISVWHKCIIVLLFKGVEGWEKSVDLIYNIYLWMLGMWKILILNIWTVYFKCIKYYNFLYRYLIAHHNIISSISCNCLTKMMEGVNDY